MTAGHRAQGWAESGTAQLWWTASMCVCGGGGGGAACVNTGKDT